MTFYPSQWDTTEKESLCRHLVDTSSTALTTMSSFSEDLELRLTHCDGGWAWALLSSARIFSSVTSSAFSALMKACASWKMQDRERGKVGEKGRGEGEDRYFNWTLPCSSADTHKESYTLIPSGVFWGAWSYEKLEPKSCATPLVVRIVRE